MTSQSPAVVHTQRNMPAAFGGGAVIGTLGGRALRARLAAALGSDRPAAVIEDLVALGGAFLIVQMLP